MITVGLVAALTLLLRLVEREARRARTWTVLSGRLDGPDMRSPLRVGGRRFDVVLWAVMVVLLLPRLVELLT
jgi:hypothetical protein